MTTSSKARKGMSHSECGRLGYLKSKKTRELKRQIRIKNYNDNPNTCYNCKSALPYEKRRNKFCSNSCAASTNNIGVNRYGETLSECLNCGGRTGSSSRIFCSKECSDIYKESNINVKPNSPHCCKYCQTPVVNTRSVFCSSKCYHCHRIEETYEKMKTENIKFGRSLRTIMLYMNEHKCVICKRSMWNGQEIPLVVDHIDGHAYNNLRSNLRLICCNCDAQLPTYKDRNKKSDRQYRRDRYATGRTF